MYASSLWHMEIQMDSKSYLLAAQLQRIPVAIKTNINFPQDVKPTTKICRTPFLPDSMEYYGHSPGTKLANFILHVKFKGGQLIMVECSSVDSSSWWDPRDD